MKRAFIIIIVMAVIAGGIYGWRRYSTQKANEEMLAGLQTETAVKGPLISTIGATGTVRSNQTAILNWQTSGTVERVLVDVGDQVVSGQELASLSQTSLPQNVILAQADLVNAQQNLEDLMNLELQQAVALQAVESAQQDLDDLLNPELQQALALQAIADAQQAVDLAETRLRNLKATASQADIDAAEAQVVITRDALDKAQDKFAPYADKPEDNLVRANLQSKLAEAQQQYDYAVRVFNGLQAKASETDLALAEANLAAAEAQLLDAERNYERIKDGPNPADVALLRAQLADSQREWERIKDGADPDDISVAEARIAAAQATLDQIHITAPFDGVLTMRESKVGDQVSPATPAFRIDDLSRLLVDLEISEVDINQIAEGLDVTLTFDAILGREYRGKVIEVGLVGADIGGIVNFNVTVALFDANGSVKPGMTSAVNIVVEQLENVLLVPNRAVRVVNNQRVVYVLEGNSELKSIEISLGASSDTHSEVVNGDIEAGDLIVLNPPAMFFGPDSDFGPPSGGRGPFGG
jgi:HlyD family secretion protein